MLNNQLFFPLTQPLLERTNSGDDLGYPSYRDCSAPANYPTHDREQFSTSPELTPLAQRNPHPFSQK